MNATQLGRVPPHSGLERRIRFVVAIALAVALSGCASVTTGPKAHAVPDPTAYWSRGRLLSATPFGADDDGHTPTSSDDPSRPPVHTASLRVGALFSHDRNGNHFCTASVVDSPGDNLLMTAAHCLEAGDDSGGANSDIVFIPGYRDGRAPFGVWKPAKLIVPEEWTRSADPDDDFGFIVLAPYKGRDIEQVLGANHLTTDEAPPFAVRITGYPASSDAPVSCANRATAFGPTQMKFVCRGLPEGTSGSPWVTNFNRKTHSGDIVGVIGGYEQGGDTDSVSYSVRFGKSVHALYLRALTAERSIAPRGTSDSS